jgi:hypothetical protein
MRATFSVVLAAMFLLTACGGLEKKSIAISVGDSKEQVISIMGLPADGQFQGENEAWQYCKTGAGFGYHDYRIIWFYRGKVTGISSYKSSRPASSCVTDIRPIKWEDAPSSTLDIRNR